MNKLRVLLADDHRGICTLVTHILERASEIVGSVGDGQALLEAAAKLKPDIIVLDISMPVLNGIEAAVKLKESGSTSRVVFLTAHADPDFINACLATGALGYVFKGRMESDLLPAIHEALKGRSFVSSISTETSA
jgi:DNA-binding NarL/FixJ family response regulator